jgi:hypothetical protein
MKFSVGLLMMLSFLTYAGAYEIQMNQGKDSYIFDYPYGNGPITVYQIDENEPYSDKMEGLMHDWFIIEDIYGANGHFAEGFSPKNGKSCWNRQRVRSYKSKLALHHYRPVLGTGALCENLHNWT